MSNNLITLKTSGINADSLQLKVLDGKSYLTGPVIMAKETVMNGLLYPADELKRSTPGWNFRPVTVGHPKKDGQFVSANSPDVLEENQIGFIFDTYTKDTDTKQVSEVWLDMKKLDKFPKVRDAIANGHTLEVSTGLFLDKVEEAGTFNGKDYSGKATNFLPDHLALLPDETGAFSVADGAGFPRINVMFGTNSVTIYERRRLLRNAFYKKMGGQCDVDGNWYYIVEVFDESFVVEVGSKLVAYEYSFDENTGALTIGDGVEVFQKVEYPPVSSIGINMSKETEPVETAPVVETPATNTSEVVEPVVTDPAPSAIVVEPEVNEEVLEAMELLHQVRAEAITAITSNDANTFTEDELKAFPVSSLKKIVALAASAPAKADMSGMGGPGGTVAVNKNEEKPYIG